MYSTVVFPCQTRGGTGAGGDINSRKMDNNIFINNIVDMFSRSSPVKKAIIGEIKGEENEKLKEKKMRKQQQQKTNKLTKKITRND